MRAKSPDLPQLEARLGHHFAHPALLIEALTHRSYLNEHREHATGHNERLEFLGDAVLELVSTDFLFKKFPEHTEGDLTSYRAALVNTVSLAESSRALGVDAFMLLSKGEAKDTGRARDVILADAFEAIIGALYLDGGYRAAADFICTHVCAKIDAVVAARAYQDPKSRFQERAQEKRGVTPVYETLAETGPDHDKRFTVGVFLGDVEIARGEGTSKQDAEQAAAENALGTMRW